MIYTGDKEITVMLGEDEIYGIYAGDLQIYPTDFGTLTGITLEDLEWVDDVPQSGGTATSANCSFNVYAYYDSGKRRRVNNKSTVTGSLVVPATTAETREYVGVLTLTASYEGFTDTDSVDVYQSTDFTKLPLTFEITSDGYVNWQSSASNIIKTIQYKLNNGSWTSVTSTTSGVHIPVVTGDKIQFKGSNTQYSSSDSRYTSFYNSTCGFIAYGNTMSLLYGDDFSGKTTLPSTFVLTRLFQSCTGLTDASNVMLPATTVTSQSYQLMFHSCSNLEKAPALPATAFTGQYNYQQMFVNCTSLTTAPVLPALSLEIGTYANLFSGCTSLSYIKCLATNRSAVNSTNNWVSGVSSTGTFVKNPNMNSWTTGTSGIPNNWTIIDAT